MKARVVRLLVVVLLVLVFSACSRVEINEVGASADGTSLGLGLNSCHGTYSVAVDESAEAVTITVTDRRFPIRFAGDDCADSWQVELSEPLGARQVIDGKRDVVMDVKYEPWNQQQYTAAEYRAALDATVACILAADPTVDAFVIEGPGVPVLVVDLGDIPDGQSKVDPSVRCSATHLDPLRR
jgi:hypothetical protein